jgi:hypothetical protein
LFLRTIEEKIVRGGKRWWKKSLSLVWNNNKKGRKEN